MAEVGGTLALSMGGLFIRHVTAQCDAIQSNRTIRLRTRFGAAVWCVSLTLLLCRPCHRAPIIGKYDFILPEVNNSQQRR